MSISSPARSQSSPADPWSELVASQTKLQADIEGALDWADACERADAYELALEWLDRASALSGGLSPACHAQHARCARKLGSEEP